ncbi:Imm71 family immunity protein, partial [Massilia glaciei]
MTQDDRRMIFWYLKRKTSYTAWRREAEAFDRFADIFERQVREEPVASPNNSIWGTNWEEFYPDILKTQV